MRFEWDPQKAKLNKLQHDLTFDEAKTLFSSDAVLEIYDVDHSAVEDRFKSIGPIERGVILVVWTERFDDVIRIISARFATKKESIIYKDYAATIGDGNE